MIATTTILRINLAASLILVLALCITCSAHPAFAQVGGEGSLQGTVTDSTGAVIPNATVTVTNTATGVVTTRESSAAGVYLVSPLPAGTYTVRVTASGFKTVEQANMVVNALQARTYDPVMSVGETTQTVEVTAAPPVLNTADATLGLTVENTTYTNLPLQMNGNQQRDPTAFGTLTPGSQAGTRLPIIGGTGNYLGQLYLEGMPAQTVNQQGDNRLVSLSMSVEAVDQFQVLTSTPPTEYMGAGAMNFTMKSGGLKYHGKAAYYLRNTAFDAWSFTAKAVVTRNAAGQVIPTPKPVEHQGELSLSFGGVVPKTGNKLFFFVAYDKYHLRKGATPQFFTIPSQAMIAGDFTELNGNVGGGGRTGTGSDNPPILFDPTTNSCTSITVCTRQPFMGIKNGVATYNVIPSAMISPIAKAMASFMPAPSNPSSLTSNYLGGTPSGFDNHLTDWRVDYTINSKQRISTVGAMGAVHYLNNFQTGTTNGFPYGYLPLPYVGGTYAQIFPKDYVVEHTYTINPRLVNQLKYSYTRFIQPQTNATDGVAQYAPAKMGISNLPAGQASTVFPGATFGTTTKFSTPLTLWTTNGTGSSTQTVTPNNFAITDNVQWVKGKHSFTFGFTHQWQQVNSALPAGFSQPVYLSYNAYSTANYAAGTLSTGSATAPSGYAFASYMLGAVAGSATGANSAPTLNLYPVSETGGRYHTFAPYFHDNYKITPKLTLDFGLRWDYLPPFHEVQDRWTFLNPNLTNAITGTAGMLQFAGSHGGAGVSCLCRTPVQTYWKNFGPRVGFAWQINQKTVLRSGFAIVFTQAGGVGGRGGNATGTGSTGFNMTATGATELGSTAAAGPSYWLNNSAAFTAKGLANTGLFGPGFQYPAAPTPSVAAQTLNTGFYVGSNGTVVPAGGVSYADPYFSGRAPQIILYNFGFERSITPDLTIGVNYAGNSSHFIINSGTTGGAARGYWSNQLNPKYLAVLGAVKDSSGTTPILTAAATPQNAAIVASYFPSAPTPPFFTAAGGIPKSTATVSQMLTTFPQYSGVTDTWGNVGNYNYQSLQVVLNQRMHNGLTYNINYTYAKNVGDDGTFRTGFDLPANAISHGTQSFKQNRIDRSWTTISLPHIIHAYGVYELPFGEGKIGSNSTAVRVLAGGWQFSGIYTYSSGTPMALTWSGPSTTSTGNSPLQGQSMPDTNPSFSGPARINGKFGSGPNGFQAANLGKVQYIDVNAFAQPQNISTVGAQYLIGNAPRTRAYGVRNPYTWNVDAGLRRTFPIHEAIAFTFEADCINVWNHVTFSNPSGGWGSPGSSAATTFGTITSVATTPGPRDWQFAGHITF